jgi:hypothetical protein
MVHNIRKCEACQNAGIQWRLLDELRPTAKPYNVCSNCLIELTTTSLKPKEFKNLLKSGHKEGEFLLHEDFYDEKGRALQPKC